MSIKPLSAALKELLIEQLKSLEVTYDENFKKNAEALFQAKTDKKEILVKEFQEGAEYWQCEYAKINKTKRLIQSIPTQETEPVYKITEDTEQVTVYEKEDSEGGDTPKQQRRKLLTRLREVRRALKKERGV
jgi:hypothetical protein